MRDPQGKIVRVFVDGEVICLDHFSGIGHYTAHLLQEVDALLGTNEFSHISMTIGAPWRLAKRLNKYGFKNISFRRMPVSPHWANALKRRGLLPPIDLLFGKQTYVFPNFSSWPTLRSPSIPIIYDLSFVLHPEFAEDRNRVFLTKQAHVSAKRATKVITISKNSKQEISEHYQVAPEDIAILYPIIDKQFFYPRSDAEILNVMAKYGIFDPYILYVGNIEPRKNLITLLKAYDQLDPKLQDKFPLLLVGAKGWKDGEIHKQIESMQARGLRVLLPTQYVTDKDMPAVISGASLFTYVSRYEGFGIPPVEAMFCGTPVISSNNSSLPEAVGNGAMLVDALDVEAITKAMKTILTDTKVAKDLIARGHKHTEKPMFVPKRAARDFLALIEEVNT